MTERTAPAAMQSWITAAVRELYEAHPYPRYPLLAKPRWQDGYASTALFAKALTVPRHPERSEGPLRPEVLSAARARAPAQDDDHKILIAGSGEIFPYIMRRWEPRSHAITCLDLSYRSLARARVRLALTPKATRFVHADIDHFAATTDETYQHIDAYGVVHHLPDPGQSLRALAARLAPGGTMRLMVYNRDARHWIHDLQRVLALGHFDPARPGDVAQARQLFGDLATHLPQLKHRLEQLGGETLKNDARFADTFMHPREARLGMATWFERVQQAGLQVAGLFDRYAELDDLVNPLWTPPTTAQLVERAADGRFENNLELYLTRPSSPAAGGGVGDLPADARRPQSGLGMTELPWALKLKTAPTSWFSYRETNSIAPMTQRALWHAFLKTLGGGSSRISPRHLARLSTAALQRLARVGAILPQQLPTDAQATASVPMCASMDKPTVPTPQQFARIPCARLTQAAFATRGVTDARRLESALRRLARFA